MPQERQIQELSRDIAKERNANEALKQVLVSQTAQQQQLADKADKERLLALDSLHAPPVSQNHLPRPPALSKPEAHRGQNQRDTAQTRTVTPRDAAGLKSPRRVCPVGTVVVVAVVHMVVVMIVVITRCAGSWFC
jgi:hypothetical protein